MSPEQSHEKQRSSPDIPSFKESLWDIANKLERLNPEASTHIIERMEHLSTLPIADQGKIFAEVQRLGDVALGKNLQIDRSKPWVDTMAGKSGKESIMDPTESGAWG